MTLCPAPKSTARIAAQQCGGLGGAVSVRQPTERKRESST
jgi:hypothetical protein